MSTGPSELLNSFRVLDLTGEEGACCTKLLAECGADVIKIEPTTGCYTRRFLPLIHGRADSEASLWFHHFQSKKRGVTLNLDTPTGQHLLLELAAAADVVLHALSPSALNQRNLSPEAFKKANSQLILAGIKGLQADRSDGPRQSDEALMLAESGILALSGNPDAEPCLPAHGLAYPIASLFAAIGILGAVEERRREPRFSHLDVNAFHAASLLTDSGIVKSSVGIRSKREGDAYSFIVPGGLYQCADGYVRIIGGQPRHWKALSEWIASDTLLQDEWRDGNYRALHREQLEREIEAFTRDKKRDWLFEEGQRRRIPISPVYRPEEFVGSVWARSRNFLQQVPTSLGHGMAAVAAPFVVDGQRTQPAAEGPRLGQHNWEVFVENLGLMTGAEMEALYAAGVL